MPKIAHMLAKVTKEFTKEKRAAAREKDDRLTWYQLEKLKRKKEKRDLEATLVAACDQIMEQVYLKVSDNGQLPAKARQMMYKARPLVLLSSA